MHITCRFYEYSEMKIFGVNSILCYFTITYLSVLNTSNSSMADSDLWREDGSFRGIQSSGGKGGKGGGGGGKGGPQFTRVIPKFLQKYHEPPAINAKFAPPPMPNGDDGDDDELDDVQQAAIAEFLEKDKAKREAKAQASASGDSNDSKDDKDAASAAPAPGKRPSQAVAGVGASTQPLKKKRKRKEMATLSNKKLLSFSLDDE